MCEPLPQKAKITEAIAPIPDPNASADSAPSKSATAFSNWVTVGLAKRE
jgi:hypothetical protein